MKEPKKQKNDPGTETKSKKDWLAQQNEINQGLLGGYKETQKELKKRCTDLSTLKTLVEDLSVVDPKITIVMKTLIKALEQTFPEYVNFAYIIPSDLNKTSKTIYVHSKKPLSKKYLRGLEKEMELSFDLLPSATKHKKELVRWVKNYSLFVFVEGSENKIDGIKLLSSFSMPLLVHGELLGMVNVSSPEERSFAKIDIDLANTMNRVTANTVARLKTILKSERSKVAAMVKSLSNGVIMFDLDQTITLINPAIEKMTGLSGQNLQLSDFNKIFSEHKMDKKISEAIEKGVSVKIDEVDLANFVYEIFITPVWGDKKDIIGGAIIMHDITHLKEVDRMKTEFVSIASHQLRTPLTPLMLFSEMLLDEEVGKLEPKQAEYIKFIHDATKRMIELVNDLLNVSRLEAGKFKVKLKSVHLNDLIKNAIEEVTPLAEKKNCEIIFNNIFSEKKKEQKTDTLKDELKEEKTDEQKKLPTVQTDPVLIRQIIHNFLTNAIRYSFEGKGQIIVTLEKRDLTEYVISVKDNGIEIPEKVQHRIFEKFFRADNAKKSAAEGSGLGLYISKMVGNLLGGNVWFKSKENEGTTFYVSIPITGMKIKEVE